MSHLFISDLHLSPERPEVTRAFFQFLGTHARQAQALYILGDLFEAWVGDDDPDELARSVVAALRALTDRGIPVYFQHGNRDFLVGRRFARETGCTLLPEHHPISIDGRRILLLHGDTLCLDDVAYQKFRRKVRNPLYRWALSSLPLRRRQKIASDWRARSMQANTNKAENIMDVTPAEVERMMQAYNADLMIHGHTHRPREHRQHNGSRVVLGDWHDQGWYYEIDNGECRLSSFPISTT